MHFAMKGITSLRAGLAGALMLVACPAAFAQSAYITQANPRSGFESTAASQPTQTVPVFQYTPSQTAFVPTPEMATPHNGNIAQTLQIGSYNHVFQSQSGGNNSSNVGIIGGNSNNVGVWQGGKDLSNLALINTQGLSIGVIQPPGSAPLNMLIARLPNGGLLIKR
ncbi:hypothetical protein [Bradyrhizobium canariense]|uniref:Minor curlin subunit n=1 Tax=Bradyrhizobium canariense TaxID=255045 RepID=A0A1H1NW93_9BRAD|nr:hypothetical protein [Bradyrhizobium canariense]SDS02639.1 hypothetical protein SAMN05444158_0764 [Bradyrhizobium canariense]